MGRVWGHWWRHEIHFKNAPKRQIIIIKRWGHGYVSNISCLKFCICKILISSLLSSLFIKTTCCFWQQILDKYLLDNLKSCIIHCVKSIQIGSFFWSVFSCIRTEYGDNSVNLRIQSEYRKIRTRKISVFGHFSGSDQ